METISKILQLAKQRALDNNLPYSGALTPKEAFYILEHAPQSRLIDVRSKAELDLVGRIQNTTHIEWSFFPGWKANPDFGTHLDVQVDKELLVMFICRSGGRSHNAAVLANQLGFTEAYNVIEGFEGETDPQTKQRGKINGWKVAGLPWTNA